MRYFANGNDEVVDMDKVSEEEIENKEEILDAEKEPDADIADDDDVDEVEDDDIDE